MNCRKCGEPLNGESKCSKCGTSIGYVVTNPDGFNLGTPNNSNGYVQNNTPSGYVQNNTTSGYVQNNAPMGFGWGVSEPSDGAFNKNYSNENNDNVDNSVGNSDLNNTENVNKKEEKHKFSGFDFGKHNDNSVKTDKKASQKSDVKKSSSGYKGRTYRPLNKFEDDEAISDTTNVSSESDNSNDGGISRSGTMSKDMIINQLNGTESNIVEDNSNDNEMTMEMPNSNKQIIICGVILLVILVIAVLGAYILPIIDEDYGYSRYEEENFVIRYSNDWSIDVSDKSSTNTTFKYLDTEYKVILSNVATFKSLNFAINDKADRITLYNSYYDHWKNIEGGTLDKGLGTFIDLEEDGSMYTRIDYVLDNDAGVGSFYVVVCEKYDVILIFMTSCGKADKKEFDEKVLEFIKGIDYVGLTALEKEQEEYLEFSAGKALQYNAGTYINYKVPDCWVLNSARTSANNGNNVYTFKDEMSLLEVRANTGYYTYDSMKNDIISAYSAIKSEDKININGKIWYVMVTLDYMNGTYHNEVYFTMSTSNKYLYYIQVYIYNETYNDSVKKEYYDDSIEYILNNMTLNGVNN